MKLLPWREERDLGSTRPSFLTVALNHFQLSENVCVCVNLSLCVCVCVCVLKSNSCQVKRKAICHVHLMGQVALLFRARTHHSSAYRTTETALLSEHYVTVVLHCHILNSKTCSTTGLIVTVEGLSRKTGTSMIRSFFSRSVFVLFCLNLSRPTASPTRVSDFQCLL